MSIRALTAAGTVLWILGTTAPVLAQAVQPTQPPAPGSSAPGLSPGLSPGLPPASAPSPTNESTTGTTPEGDEQVPLLPAAEEGPRYPPPSARWKAAGLGLLATGVFYGAAAGTSLVFPDAPGAHDLRIPVAGPWLAIAHNGCPPDNPNCSNALVIVRTVLSAIDGVAQAGGLAIMLEGLFMPTQEVAPASSSLPLPTPTPASPGQRPPEGSPSPSPTSPAPSPPTNGTRLFYVPLPMTVGVRGIGLGVIGRF